jgi:hypothetical protein
MGPTTGRPCGCAVRIHSCYRASKPGVFVMYYCFPHRHDHHLPFTRIKLILAISSMVLTILCCTAGVCSQRWVKSAHDMCIYFSRTPTQCCFPLHAAVCSQRALTQSQTLAHLLVRTGKDENRNAWTTLTWAASVTTTTVLELDPVHGVLHPLLDDSPWEDGLQVALDAGGARLFIVQSS